MQGTSIAGCGIVRRTRRQVVRQEDCLSSAQWRTFVSLAAAGDPAAEELLFEHLRRRMVSLAGRALRTNDVDDLVQDVLIIVHSKYRDLLAESKLQDRDGFDRWWRRILHHRIGNDIRRRRFECDRRLPEERLMTVPSVDAADRLCETSELRHVLLRALGHLNASQRSFLRESVDPSDPTAGPRVRRDAKYARVYRARKALRRALKVETSFG
jgi:DNA-directed RNA polymerase specialized sigma24 family protein